MLFITRKRLFVVITVFIVFSPALVAMRSSLQEYRRERLFQVYKKLSYQLRCPIVMIGSGVVFSTLFGTVGVLTTRDCSNDVIKSILFFLSGGCGGVAFGECLRSVWYCCDACQWLKVINSSSVADVAEINPLQEN